jgi:hypothetical protein
MPANEVDPIDRDFLIRTIIGEAANQPDLGKAAVAHVVLNRVSDGGFQGDNIQQVVTAPKQFEPWGTRAAALKAIPPTSPQYQDAASIADGVLSGIIPDPTGGATHFANVKTVAQRGDPAGRPGGWLSQMGNVTQIGDHTFGNADAGRSARPKADTMDVWGELEKNASSNVGKGFFQPSDAQGNVAPDVWGELTARAQGNAKPATATAEAPRAAAPPATSAATAVASGALGGVPVVGPAILGGAERAAAGINSLVHGTPYDQELARAQGLTNQLQQEHPIATGIGNAYGAVASTVPLMAAAPAAFGIGEGAMLARTAASALTGAGLGGADAASRSAVANRGLPSGGEVAKGAAIGGAFGAAGPIGGQLIGQGANKLYDAASNVLLSRTSGISTGARNALMAAIGQDTPDAIRAELSQLGPKAMLADTGSATQGLAQGVAVKPGGSELIKQIEARTAGAQDRIRQAVSRLGPAEDAQTVKDTIIQTRKALDSVNYPAALENAPPVDVKPIVKQIDRLLETAEGKQKTALESLRGNLVEAPAQPAVPGGPTGLLDASGSPMVSTGKPATEATYKSAAENLHNIKGEIDAVINHGAPGLGVEQGAVARQQGALKLVRGQLNEALERQIPGYAEANKASSALAKRAEAVEAGYKNTLSGSATQNGQALATPERFKAEFDTKPLGEQVAQAKGLLARINQMVGVNRNDLGAMRNALQGEEGWNTGKMATVLGDQPVNNLMGAVNRETAFGQTHNAVVGNAQSAFRTEAARALDKANPAPIDLTGVTGVGLATAAGRKAYTTVMGLLTRTDTAGVERELAKILSAQGPERDKFLAALTQAARVKAPSAAVQRGIERGGNMLIQSAQEPYRLAR